MEKPSSLAKYLPSGSTLIREEDIRLWVQAAVHTALPELERPFREAKELQDEMLTKMLAGMDRNCQKMSETIAQQARLFICMGIAGFVIADPKWSRREKATYTAAALAGFLVFSKLLDRCFAR
mmetsp:Transcript_92151/g.199245  ORF Transcript_92151/g.199245 Transcript_92151/m.199245 type:complete len:123 (-) Transcript_92151:23-391(-)